MNRSNLTRMLCATAMAALSACVATSCSDGSKGGQDDKATENAVVNNIMTRTSVRDYQERDVEDGKVETMLRAAMAAPTAGNKQPWRFVIVKDKKTLREISDSIKAAKMAEKAPMAIVVCGDMHDTFPADGHDYWVEDASAATENLLLAAHGLGLGAVWCGIYPVKERVAFIRDLLQLPEYIVPLNVIPVGYPAENPEPKDKWKPENIHYERWGGQAGTAQAGQQ